MYKQSGLAISIGLPLDPLIVSRPAAAAAQKGYKLRRNAKFKPAATAEFEQCGVIGGVFLI